ncbi:unnamed protein product [Discula destructiva]
MPPISMFDDDHLGSYPEPGEEDFLGLFQPHDSDPKGIDSVLLQPAQSAPLPTTLSPNASDQDSASDSSPSPNNMNNVDEDFDMFSYTNNQSGDWSQFEDFTTFGDAPATEQNTINPSLIQGDFATSSLLDPHHSSSPSESTSSNGMGQDSDESPSTEPMDATMHMVFPKFVANDVSAANGLNGVAKVTRSAASHSRKKRNSKQPSISRSTNGMSTSGSREPSPMLFSQGSSPLASMPVPEPRPVPQRAVPQNSWFDVSPGQNQWPNGQMTQPTFQGAVPAYAAPLVQANSVPPLSPITTLAILDMPRKSRVETQIHLKMSLHPVPQGITKIRLPRHTISKPKFLAKPKADHRPDTLELSTQLVCSSAMAKPGVLQRARARAAAVGPDVRKDPQADDDKAEDGGEVRICTGCITREQKRANRKKNNRPGEDDEWKNNETERVIVFNTNEIKELKAPEYNTNPGTMLIDIPMRIACYCRHHHEKLGFKIIFTLKNHTGQIVAQELSPSIMITDDHKTPQTNGNSVGGMDQIDAASPNDLNSIPPGLPFRQSQSTSDLQALQIQAQKRSASDLVMPVPNSGASSVANSTLPTPNISRPPSPGAIGPSAAKKRKSSSSKVPTTLTMTRIEAPSYAPAPSIPIAHGLPGPSATSPFSPQSSLAFSETPTSAFAQGPPNPTFPAGPRTPNGNEQNIFQPDANRAPNSDAMPVPPMYSGPASSQNSRATSPNSMMNSVLQQQPLNLLSNTNTMATSFANTNVNGLRHPMPVILKVLPVDGPTSGGIEVSILGSGFRQGHDIYFGETKATTTTYWADSAMTCLLPPYSQPGHVPVSVRASNGQMQSLPRPQATFLYKDDDQDELKHMALRVLTHKMTGKVDDASLKGFINKVLRGEDGMNGNSFNGGGPSGYTMNLETQLMKVLDLLDMDDSIYKAKLNMKKKTTGHTMLHLSVALGYNWLTAGLLARGANPNVQDNGGYTPLHFAAMHDHPALVRRLIQSKADPTLRTRHGLLASDIATTREVVRAIKRAGRRGSTLHSRASSATSLRSFWEPPRVDAASPEEFSYSESSESDEIEASSSEEDFMGEDSFLDMTVRSRRHHGTISSRASLVDLPHPEEQGGMASAAVAIAAFKEQIQQLQQTMLQNMSHLQMPNMMQDCQAYLNSAQQRMSAYIPNIPSPFLPGTTLPPAYHDIFPGGRDDKRASIEHGDMDTKVASAARAAADYEADEKCTVRYDQQQAIVQDESSTTVETPVQEKQVQRQLPKLLQIGRKNNITKEQQDNLRQARAESQKSLSKDAKLFLFWIPLLVLICFRMFHDDFSGPLNTAWNFASSLWQQPAQGVVLGEVH